MPAGVIHQKMKRCGTCSLFKRLSPRSWRGRCPKQTGMVWTSDNSEDALGCWVGGRTS